MPRQATIRLDRRQTCGLAAWLGCRLASWFVSCMLGTWLGTEDGRDVGVIIFCFVGLSVGIVLGLPVGWFEGRKVERDDGTHFNYHRNFKNKLMPCWCTKINNLFYSNWMTVMMNYDDFTVFMSTQITLILPLILPPLMPMVGYAVGMIVGWRLGLLDRKTDSSELGWMEGRLVGRDVGKMLAGCLVELKDNS